MKDKMAKRHGIAISSSRVETKTRSARARLLLVEDHGPTRASLQRLLTSRNFDVRAAACVADAWELASSNEFDLLLSDIGLPDGDGYLLMRELQERYGLKGIALTGFGMEDDIELSKEAGFSLHLVKPVRASALDEAFASLGL
jgi:CheY-like chemotaxis protein